MKFDLPNFTDATIGNAPLVDGIYTVNVTQPPTRETKNDKVSIKIVMKVVAGPDQASADENGSRSPVGREVWDFIPMQANCMWRMKRLLVAAGLLTRDDKTSELAQGSFEADKLVGSTFQVKCYQEMYEGKNRPRVDYVI